LRPGSRQLDESRELVRSLRDQGYAESVYESSFHQMRLNQSDAAVAVGFCFIISSMPFFISFAEGSALWVPTIQL